MLHRSLRLPLVAAPLTPHHLVPPTTHQRTLGTIYIDNSRSSHSNARSATGLAAMSAEGATPSTAPLSAGAAAAAAATAGPEIALDKSLFNSSFRVIAVRVPKDKCSQLRAAFKDWCLTKAKLRGIVPDDSDPESRLFCLADSITTTNLEGLPDNLKQLVASYPILEYDYPTDYSLYLADDVLRRIMPPGIEVPSAFETVGHIAHLNLKSEQLPYKHLIGTVILDKNPGIKTVVNKLGNIETEFRVFPMEVLAGEERFEARVKQHGCVFHLDFREVYWNSRLETEHKRLVELFRPGDVVCDAMCGIGPFAVPSGKRGCLVYANDLNPRSIFWLRTNIQKNRLGAEKKKGPGGVVTEVPARVLPFNLDARLFIRLMCGHVSLEEQARLAGEGVAPAGPHVPPGTGLVFDHVVMNLPASAVEFVDAFRFVFPDATWADRPLPLVHCYTFARGTEDEAKAAARASVEHYLGGSLDEEPQVFTVRDVAPNKMMFCVSFRVPRALGLVSAAPAVGAGAGADSGAEAAPRVGEKRAADGPADD